MRGTEKRKSRRTMSHGIPETDRCVVVVHRRAVIVIVIVAVIVTETVIVADDAPAVFSRRGSRGLRSVCEVREAVWSPYNARQSNRGGDVDEDDVVVVVVEG